MTLNDNTSNNEMAPSKLSLLALYNKYPIIPLSFSDLYTYEIIILLVYGIIVIFSFFTNSIAIIIFFFGRRSRSELTPFFLNLSVFNIIMTVYCIPFTITSLIFKRWLYARALCVVLDGFKTFSVSGVLLTLITIAIDRYCVVKYPLTIKVYSPKKRNLLAILVIWILSIALALLWSPARSLPTREQRLWVSSRKLFDAYLNSLNSVENATTFENSSQHLKPPEHKLVDTVQCLPNKTKRPVEVRRIILNLLQTYFIPLFILTFVYSRIAVILWRRKNDVNFELNNLGSKNLFTNENIQFKNKLKQGIKILVTVVVLHAILWLPMNLFQLCFNLICYQGTAYQAFCSHPTLIKFLYIAAHFLTVSNTAINPIIYGFTNNRFRSDIRQLIRRLIHCQARNPVYFEARFAKNKPQVLANCPNKTNRQLNVTAITNRQLNAIAIKNQNTTRKLNAKQPLSLTDQNKFYRNNYSTSIIANDQFITKVRHTT
ncbi:unnamed protein product [Rotaria magnacalcarata]|uniref:G-protein coupled receptors family 1 profile domain-containing protein n=1 Tax=Rotaria magnacalcarata TaxID=392030 RepID=A0A815PF43_9BILA|nr:unnamed protein product [Rotaria magnacalcarata]CAF1448076.1 unnamed protein product [Rotaria magnacalcarata]CAF2067964.1 unnamed protein product [Rotaria magnacalcarata]CAF3894866.1 unnamed protein product [Rotaria magnacalcarata]CAF3924208.1 unnamed protein product [Rotaria magnacalcarata]